MTDIFRIISQAEWRPGIGDPTIVGWFSVFLYFLTAYQCFLIYRDNHYPLLSQRGRERCLWLFILIAMIALGINKQLDLQSLLTEIAKAMSKEQGWYFTRREIQRQFILAVVFGGSILIVVLFAFFRKILKRNFIAIIGLCTLVMFIIIRASSFHHFDYFSKSSSLGLNVNWILEIGGISLILINALMILNLSRKNNL